MMKRTAAALFLFFFLAAALSSYLRKSYLKSFYDRSMLSTQNAALDFYQGKSNLQDFMKLNPDAIYIAASWLPKDQKIAYINQGNLQKNTKSAYALKIPRWENFEKTLLPNENLADEYTHVVHAHLHMPSIEGLTLDVGDVKAAYLLPGTLFSLPLGRAFSFLIYLLWATSAFFAAISLKNWLVPMPAQKKPSLPPYIEDEEEEPSDLNWLETENGVTQPIFVDEKGRSWNVLFPTPSLHLWSSKGSYYIRDQQLNLKPWATSLTRKDLQSQNTFEFLARAYRLSGPDGFIITFKIAEHSLYWVIGGWNNSISELAGYPNTKTQQRLLNNVWYLIEVKCKGDFLSGYLNGEKCWSIPISQIDRPSPDQGFEEGFGVATWNSLVKYTDIRVLHE